MVKTNRDDLAHAAVEGTGCPLDVARAILEAFLTEVVERVAAGGKVKIRGIGTFYPKWRKARDARNVKTGEVVPLPRCRVFLFRYGLELEGQIRAALGGHVRWSMRKYAEGKPRTMPKRQFVMTDPVRNRIQALAPKPPLPPPGPEVIEESKRLTPEEAAKAEAWIRDREKAKASRDTGMGYARLGFR
jgi:nucleoid DNA-binding protein